MLTTSVDVDGIIKSKVKGLLRNGCSGIHNTLEVNSKFHIGKQLFK